MKSQQSGVIISLFCLLVCIFFSACNSSGNNVTTTSTRASTATSTTASPTSTPNDTGTPCSTWTTMPLSLTQNEIFHGVAASSPNDAWAVGGDADKTLIKHWDGNSWGTVNSPNMQNMGNALWGVTAISTSDAWAVGVTRTQTGTEMNPLIEHWDGTAWSIVQNTDLPHQNGSLSSVAAVSANDIWAVGSANGTLVEHWDGTQWKVVPSPGALLNKVAAIAANDIWAVGSANGTLVEHWDGTQWKIVPSPNFQIPLEEQRGFKEQNSLSSVSAVGPNDVWAVGKVFTPDSAHTYTAPEVIEHWDGQQWNAISMPFDANSGAMPELQDVVALSTNDVWAAGREHNNRAATDLPFFIHWDGSQWSRVAGPSTGINWNPSFSLAKIPGSHQIWAVGHGSGANGTAKAAICK